MFPDPIASFTGPYRFLSNFYSCTIVLDCVIYSSVENAYQAAKTLDEKARVPFMSCTAAQAKKLGRGIRLREDWEQVKVDIMRQLLLDKFRSDRCYSAMLLSTAPRELIEGNYWGDHFWGVCNGRGENMLGKLLMEIRDGLNR